nr:MAG TPA: hypothetical protein [Caudoviricetes sp.]
MVIVIRSARSGFSLNSFSSSCRAFFASLSIGFPSFLSGFLFLPTHILYHIPGILSSIFSELSDFFSKFFFNCRNNSALGQPVLLSGQDFEHREHSLNVSELLCNSNLVTTGFLPQPEVVLDFLIDFQNDFCRHGGSFLSFYRTIIFACKLAGL